MNEYFKFTISSSANHDREYTAVLSGKNYWVTWEDCESPVQYHADKFSEQLNLWKADIKEVVVPTNKVVSVQELVERVKEDIETVSVSHLTKVKYNGITYQTVDNDFNLAGLVQTLKETTDDLKAFVVYP